MAPCVLSLPGCLYHIDVQQGNVIEQDALDQVEVGMTRSQVQFLLGTPMVTDAFHQQRWDYAYYLQEGKSRDIHRRWVVVYFDDDRVVRIDRDLPAGPAS